MSSSISIPTSLYVAQKVTNAIADYEFLKFFDCDYKAHADLDYCASNARRIMHLINNRPTNSNKYNTDRIIKKIIGEFLNKIEIITQANKKLRTRVKKYKEQAEVLKNRVNYEKSRDMKERSE